MTNKVLIILLPMIIISAFLVSIDPVHSEELNSRWNYYATDGNKGKHYYDIESIVRGKTIKVWETSIGGTFKKWRSLREINCVTREYRILQSTIEYEENLNLAPKILSEPTLWEGIEPETWMETLYDIMCEKKGK